jgi:lipoyl-dependent peroxiredoxin
VATRNGSAEWRGNLKEGAGDLKVGEGVFEGAYSFSSRFEEGQGTNPEELIGAAHAACFSMALSNILAEGGHEPDLVRTTARVQLRVSDEGPRISHIELETEGRGKDLDEEHFAEHAEKAKAACPVSKALAGVGEITVRARLAS